MFRMLATFALLALAGAAHAEQVVPLTIGKSEVRFALPDGYLRASVSAPSMFAGSAAALPPAIRLVEAALAEGDLKRTLTGQDMLQPYLQVQAMRDAEAIDFSIEDWRQLQPMMAMQLGATDLTATSQALQDDMGERMGKATGGAVEFKFGEVGKPRVYSQAGDVIRYVLRLPVNATVNGREIALVLDCAGAMLVLNGKLLTVNVYLRQAERESDFAQVRALLEQTVQRAMALNPRTAG